jgi:hypothetical protein
MGKKPDTTGKEIYSSSTGEPIPWMPDPMRHDPMIDEFLPDKFIEGVRSVLRHAHHTSVTLQRIDGTKTEYRLLTEDEAAEWAVEIELAKKEADHG